jgi:hypothetical protein
MARHGHPMPRWREAFHASNNLASEAGAQHSFVLWRNKRQFGGMIWQ